MALRGHHDRETTQEASRKDNTPARIALGRGVRSGEVEDLFAEGRAALRARREEFVGQSETSRGDSHPATGRLHRRVTLTLQGILLFGAGLAVTQRRWLVMAATLAIVFLTLLPVVLRRRFRVTIPPEFEVLAVVFIYASLFLGEVRGYYVRFWWWDAVLHTGSGFLLGIVGFLLVHVLNEHENIDLHMRPIFVALFAFMFAMGMGALWEIFEFSMDRLLGMNMQKSGLVDTMWDLIVDGIGALVISVFGWVYLRTAGTDSFLERWIQAFISANPRLFSRSRTPPA